MSTHIPAQYASKLNLYDTQKAISEIKRLFQDEFADKMHLKRVSAPLFVEKGSGINDDLNGCERPVCFDIPAAGAEAEIVHSLAKWKRLALYRYGFHMGNGLYTDMNAIRRDELTDNLHSVYVDQWDWEKVIGREQRTIVFLEDTVKTIAAVIEDTQTAVCRRYDRLTPAFNSEVTFVSSQQLEDKYPNLTPPQREYEFVKKHGTVFITQIGGALRSGMPHDGRAPDYDDWNLNGDLICYNELLDCAMELSSMGIRVDAESLAAQLKAAGCEERAGLRFHKMLAAGELPLTIGGGIGQSRLCMLMLNKAHIGEVQSSIWDKETTEICAAAGVALL